jgi:hypothetical protein
MNTTTGYHHVGRDSSIARSCPIAAGITLAGDFPRAANLGGAGAGTVGSTFPTIALDPVRRLTQAFGLSRTYTFPMWT